MYYQIHYYNIDFILKIRLDDMEMRLETYQLNPLQEFIALVKKYKLNAIQNQSTKFGDSHAWIEIYRPTNQISTDDQNEIINSKRIHHFLLHLKITELQIDSKHSNHAQNPFIDETLNSDIKDFKSIKRAWLAKQLRTRELEFCNLKDLKIWIGSWNVNGKLPTIPLNPWINIDPLQQPDILVFAFQELDISTQAHLLTDTIKKQEWTAAIIKSLGPDSQFSLISSKQLVGMLILLFIHNTHTDTINDISAEHVACGMLGMMGNKGAVAIRFKLYDSYIVFVNSHLAADKSQTEKRNQDYMEIAKRMVFDVGAYDNIMEYNLKNPWVCTKRDTGLAFLAELNQTFTNQTTDQTPIKMKRTCSIFDTDYLFWMGDLNYRVSLPDAQVREEFSTLDTSIIQKILQFDQLTHERNERRSFHDFKEHHIEFLPTYKYDVGTSLFDSSEKKRAPGWCDRILWYTNPLHSSRQDIQWITPLSYTSVMDFKISDHKPVMSLFNIKARLVDQERMSIVYDDIVQELDTLENDAVPELTLSQNILQMGRITFLNPTTQTFVIENTGRVIARFSFIPNTQHNTISKQWCILSPIAGMLLPGEKITISVTVLVNATSAHLLNFGEALEDILILHTENGKDYFVSVVGDWTTSCFGNAIEVLCRKQEPMEALSSQECKRLYDLIESQKSWTPNQTNESLVKKSSVPKEIWRLVDFIYTYGLVVDNIFFESGDEEVMRYIRQCLDSGQEFDLEALLAEEEMIRADFERAISSKSISIDTAHTTSIDHIPLNIDLILNTTCRKVPNVLIAPRHVFETMRHVIVHSFVDTLFLLLDSFMITLVTPDLHYSCVLEGYHSYIAAKHILKKLPETHYHLFTYLTAFFKEFMGLYEGKGDSPLNRETMSSKIAPFLLKMPIEYDEADASSGDKVMYATVNGKKTQLDRIQYTMKRKMFVMHFLDTSNTPKPKRIT